MVHKFRFYHTYPATPTPMERRRGTRLFATCMLVGLGLCAAAVIILFTFVLQLRAARIHSIQEQQQQMDQAMCSVLNEFHRTSPELLNARRDLHCPAFHA